MYVNKTGYGCPRIVTRDCGYSPLSGTLKGARSTPSQAERQKDLLRKISAYAAAGKEPEEESEEDTASSPEPWMLPGELDQARALHGQGCAGPGDGPMFLAMWHRDAGCHKASPRSLDLLKTQNWVGQQESRNESKWPSRLEKVHRFYLGSSIIPGLQ